MPGGGILVTGENLPHGYLALIAAKAEVSAFIHTISAMEGAALATWYSNR